MRKIKGNLFEVEFFDINCATLPSEVRKSLSDLPTAHGAFRKAEIQN